MDKFKKAIKNHLDERAKTDSLFARTYAKPNKNIDECCNFIISQVKKLNRTAMTDDEVYSLAVHYYDEDEITDVKPIRCKVVTPGDEEQLSEEDKAQMHEEAKKLYAQRLADQMEKKRKEKERKARERALKRKAEEPQQLSLF